MDNESKIRSGEDHGDFIVATIVNEDVPSDDRPTSFFLKWLARFSWIVVLTQFFLIPIAYSQTATADLSDLTILRIGMAINLVAVLIASLALIIRLIRPFRGVAIHAFCGLFIGLVSLVVLSALESGTAFFMQYQVDENKVDNDIRRMLGLDEEKAAETDVTPYLEPMPEVEPVDDTEQAEIDGRWLITTSKTRIESPDQLDPPCEKPVCDFPEPEPSEMLLNSVPQSRAALVAVDFPVPNHSDDFWQAESPSRWQPFTPGYAEDGLLHRYSLKNNPLVTLSPTLPHVYLVDGENTLRLFSLSQYRELTTVALPFDCAEICSTGSHLIAASKDDGRLYLLDPLTLKPDKTIDTGPNLSMMAVSADFRFALVNSDTRFSVVDLQKNRVVQQIVKPSGYRFDYNATGRALGGITSMVISNDGQYLYTLNHCVHELRIGDDLSLTYISSSPEIIGAKLGLRAPLQISSDGSNISVLSLRRDPSPTLTKRNYPVVGLMKTNALYEGVYFWFEMPDYASAYHFYDGIKALEVHRYFHGGSLSCSGVDESFHSPYYNTKEVYDIPLCVKPVRNGLFVWANDRIVLLTRNQDAKTVFEARTKDSERPDDEEGYQTPETRFAEEMKRYEQEGWQRNRFDEYDYALRGNVRTVARFTQVDAYRDIKPIADHSRILVRTSPTIVMDDHPQCEFTEYDCNFEPVETFRIDDHFSSMGNNWLQTANLDDDPEDEIFYWNMIYKRRCVAAFNRDNTKLFSTDDDPKAKALLNALQGNGSAYPVDCNGDGIREIAIFMRFDTPVGNDRMNCGKIAFCDNQGHVRVCEKEYAMLPQFRSGDTDGDGADNMYIVTHEPKFFGGDSGFQRCSDQVIEIDEYGNEIRVAMRSTEFAYYNTRLVWSPELQQAVFVGVRYLKYLGSDNWSMRVECRTADGDLRWSYDTQLPGDYIMYGEPDSPYFVLPGGDMHHLVFHADRPEPVGELAGFAPVKGMVYMHHLTDSDTEKTYLTFSGGHSMDIIAVDEPTDDVSHENIAAENNTVDKDSNDADTSDARDNAIKTIVIKSQKPVSKTTEQQQHLSEVLRQVVASSAAIPSDVGYGINVTSNERFSYREDFDKQLALDWTIYQPDPSLVDFDKTPGCMTIGTERGCIQHSSHNTRKKRVADSEKACKQAPGNILLLEAPGDTSTNLAATLHIKNFTPDSIGQECGLLFFKDKDEFVKWSVRFDDFLQRPALTLDPVCNTGPYLRSPLTLDKVDVPEEIWLRVVRNNRKYEFHYSLDGEQYHLAMREGIWGDRSFSHIGVYSSSGTQEDAPSTDVAIESFELASLDQVPNCEPLLDDIEIIEPFDGETVLGWKVLNPDPDAVSFGKTPGCITITTGTGSYYRDVTQPGEQGPSGRPPRNAYLLDNPAGGGDMIVTMHVKDFRPTEGFQQCDLLFYNDSNNYVCGQVKYDDKDRKAPIFTLLRETGGRTVYTPMPKDIDIAENFWIRIVKTGTAYRFMYSETGEQFRTLGDINWIMQPRQVGFMTSHGTSPNTSSIDIAIDQFSIVSPTYDRQPAPSPALAWDNGDDLLGCWRLANMKYQGQSYRAKPKKPPVLFGFYSYDDAVESADESTTTYYVGMKGEKEALLRLDTQSEPARFVLQAKDSSDSVHGIIKRTDSGLTLCFSSLPDSDYPEAFGTAPYGQKIQFDLIRIAEPD